MKPCFGYIRVSTVKQGDGVSLPEQKAAIERFAAANYLIVTKWFEEKETAAKSGRPVFNAMIRDLKAGKATGMIIHKIDRSARNPRDWATVGELSDAGVDVYFATESLDFRSRGGRLTADIQAVIAADYIRNLSQEARKGINGRLKQGIYPFPAPLGYTNTGRGNPKAIDPIRAPLVRELFDRYLTGNYSIRSLHLKMRERGLTTRGGKLISKRTVEQVLQNPFYCGLMRNGRTKELFPGIHDKLITAAQFERIQAIKSGRYVKKVAKHSHLLRRLFHCSQCGSVLTPERQKNRYTYYRCHTVSCPCKTVREEVLESAIKTGLAEATLHQDDETKIDARYPEWKQHHSYQAERQSVELRMSQAEARLDKLTDLLIDGRIDQAAYGRKRDTILIEIEKLKEERADIASLTADEEDRRKFLELMKTLAPLYETAEAAEKRVLVENCFSNRTWDGEYVCLEPSELVQWARDSEAVPYGGEFKDTVRKFIAQIDNVRTEQQDDLTA